MRIYRNAGLGLVALIAFLPGCATKKYVDDGLATQASKIQSVESGVEENQRRIKEVDGKVGAVDAKASQAQQTGEQAMSKGTQAYAAAEEAKKLARGKLVLEVTLTDDVDKFTVNKWALPDGAMQALDDVAKKVLAMDHRVYLEIHGHTDASGTDKWNDELGLRRAEAARRYLSERGIPLYAMSVISHGSSKPVADNSSPDGRAQNRRVVVRVLE